FQLVEIVERAKAVNKKILLETLASLPNDLSTMYDNLLTRIKLHPNKNVVEVGSKGVTWCYFALRPLSKDEFHEAIEVIEWSKESERDDTRGPFEDNMECFQGLIKLRQGNVGFVHASAKDHVRQ